MAGSENGSRRREAMSKVDTAWLRMERPTNLMMITGVMILAKPINMARLNRMITERFLAYPRFHQKAVENDGAAHWEDDPDFDLEWHARRTALPGAAGQEELQQLVSSLASSPLDHSKPLWQFHLVESYQGGSALIIRIHHCYADGIALVQVVLSLTDISAKPKQGATLPDAWLKDDHHRVAKRFHSPAREQFDRAVKFGSKLLGKSVDLMMHPTSAATLAIEARRIATELGHALSLADDPQTRLKGPLGVSKHCAWAEPLDLEEVKAIGRGFDCTVNDVLLACAAGALRSYMVEQGDQIDGVTIRATVPVNLRPLEHAKKLGNHFGLVFLDLPIGERNPVRRLEIVAANMRELKQSRQAMVTYGLLAAVGMAPAPVQKMALDLLSHKASAVATNVPGPQMPLFMAGSEISEMMFWVPQSGDIGLGISILSYHGKVYFGLMADGKRIPQPADIIRRFRPEFEKLLYAVLMEDWQRPVRSADCAATLDHYA